MENEKIQSDNEEMENEGYGDKQNLSKTEKRAQRKKNMRRNSNSRKQAKKVQENMKGVETKVENEKMINILNQRIMKKNLAIRNLQRKLKNYEAFSTNKSREPFRVLSSRSVQIPRAKDITAVRRGTLDTLLAVSNRIHQKPVTILEGQVTPFIDTKLEGSYGSIKRTSLNGSNVVVKCIDPSRSSELAVSCEAKIMLLVSHHPLFPTLYGILGTHKILMEDLGLESTSGYMVRTIQNTAGSAILTNQQWVKVAKQIVQGVIHLHGISILHNDLKANNVILRQPSNDVVIIDFGKATLLEKPLRYVLKEDDRKTYNENHRYLAHELRNEYGTSQSVSTDTYSTGYMFRNIGLAEKFQFLVDTGKKMKVECASQRMDLTTALELLKNYRDT